MSETIIRAHPQYLKMCERKAFLLSKPADSEAGFACRTEISNAKFKIQLTHGAKMGAGATRKYLSAAGFTENKPLGAGKIIQNEELCLHHTKDGDEWVRAYGVYSSKTRYGTLIPASTPENFAFWAKSEGCKKEADQVPDGRLFAYIEHNDEDEGGEGGYIVYVEGKAEKGSATVSDGQGYVIFASGNYYHGPLKNGIIHTHSNTKGKCTYIDGNVYEGEWKRGEKHGKGYMTYADGAIYEGEWVDGEKHGKGRNTYMRAVQEEDDTWVNEYDGEYDGDFERGEMHGLGKYTFPSGNVYIGQWSEGNMHGRGKMAFASGDTYDGDYEEGKRHGSGIITWMNGSAYEGELKNGEFHGQGRKTYKSGEVEDGKWANDKFLG